MMFWHRVGGSEGFGFVDGAHMFCQRVGACEGAVTFWILFVS